MSATNSSTIPSNVSWSFAEDSSFQIPNNLKDVVYHPSLNVLLVFTHDNQILIFDATSGVVYKQINSIGKEGLKCCYLPTLERLVVASDDILSTRKDHNGVLLLDNLLQQHVQNPEDVITAVLSLNDAIHLLEASSCLDSVGMDNIAELFKDLEQEVFRVKEATKSNHKEAKWATVCLKKPQGALLKSLNSLLVDMKRIRMDLPGLSVISSLVDQVSLFSSSSELLHPFDSSGVIDKGLMHNECVRRSTFKDWPHLNYKWALPIPMAQAGFYYHPNTSANNGDDRAMCFVCNVCLIYWEATDEPWSEHERHSPHCPFVKGEYTQNVPISATHAGEPAKLHALGDNITNIGCTTSDRFFATVLSNSYVVVWDINTFLKEYVVVHVSPNDPIVASKTKLMNCFVNDKASDEPQKMSNGRELPSCDVNVGSTCIISQPSEINSETLRPGNSKNFLIVGATFNFHSDGEESKDLDMSEVSSADGKSTDVMMLNRLNQEKNGGGLLTKTEPVVSGAEVGTASLEIKESMKKGKAMSYMCLLVYSLTTETKRDAIKDSTPSSSSSTSFKQKQNNLGLKKSIGKMYSPHQDPMSDMNIVEDILDDDPDIQIVDFKLPLSFEAEEVPSKPKPKIILTSNSGQVANFDASVSAAHLAQNLQEHLQNQAILCIPLPGEIKSSSKLSVKFILPTNDGGRLLVVVGVEPDRGVADECKMRDDDDVVCWTVIYKVSYYKSGPLLDSKPLAVSSHKEMITSACLLPTDACQLLMYNDEDSSSDDNLLVVNVKGESAKGQSAMKRSVDDDVGKWENAENDMQDYQFSMKKLFGSALVVTSEGNATILSLTDLSVMSTLKSGSSNKNDSFISATYCSGIDRICLVTRSNQLKFFSLKPTGDQDVLSAMDGSISTEDVSFDSVDGSIEQNLGASPKGADQSSTSQLLMAQKKLNADVLIGLRRLIYYKNLTPRFVSTVPPHWKEVVQEQQQRKHPQHLHQHGEGVQHTRSWKLQTDSTVTNDENIFELVLPVPTIVGHVLLRFSLNHSIHHSTPPPQIRVTLLRQKPNSKPGQAHNLDEHIDFGLAPGNKRNESFSKDHYIESLEKRYKAKVVYGPIDLADHVDISGSRGIIPMSSKLLMRDWSKTLLFHFKVINLTSKNETQCIFPPAQMPAQPKQANSKKTDASKTNEWDSVVTGKPPPGPSSPTNLRQNVRFKANDSIPTCQGNVTMQEISITIRKFRKFGACQKDQASKMSLNLSSLENRMAHLRRLNRSYMLENSSFHERLLEIIAGREKLVSVGSIKNVKLHLALDILIWIINVTKDEYCSEQNVGRERTDVLKQLQGCMAEVLRTCLLCSDRSLAHKCARMFAACFINCNHSAQLGDTSIAVEFQTSLLTALISCLPLIMTTPSAGSIHWFFVLFNHVKHLDPSLASLCCGELLTRVAEEYGLRNDDLHAFLRTKLGLCGSPLDPELFDLDPTLPGISKGVQAKVHQPQPSASAPISNSYAGVVMGQSSLYGSVLGGAPITSGSISMHGPAAGFSSTVLPDEGMFKDLMYLLDLERNFGAAVGDCTLKNEQNSRFMTGLLESEPLHFTCHSASDGTRMEELDAASQSMIASAMQPGAMMGANDSFGGPFNDAMMVFDAATGAQMNIKGGHFGALSGSMGTSMDDSQLQQLHNKQMMLLKLQMQKKKLEQKLAETTKAMSVGSSKQSGSTTSNLFNSDFPPPAPKNTPFFMTPPLTPSEIYPNLFSSITLPDSHLIGGKNSDGSKAESEEYGNSSSGTQKLSFSWQQTKNIFQAPTPYALVIDRVHSGARRFIVLDFGKPICLTDVIIPACSDVASMSIDVWLNSERVDGQRLVESNDIWSTNLIMCDILPPPICRFLKVTTIRRYGGNTGRSKIPIGSFYGHTFIVPWQRVSDVSLTSMLSSSLHLNLTQQSEAVMTPNERNQAMAQLNICMSLLEDIQCSYGMARSRLSTLVSSLMSGSDHATSLMLLPKGKTTVAEERVVQAYHKTTQLQIQLNLAKRAVYRLQHELGLNPQQSTEGPMLDLTNTAKVKSILTSLNKDTLKYLAEQLSSVLLGLSAGIPPSINVNIGIFQSTFVEGLLHAESLFSSLCVLNPSRKLQTTTGVLLARTCGDLPWWGDFFGKIFFEFFAADQKHIFPQDRLFILMVYLGQKSLCSSSAGHVLESVLGLLSKTLTPLHSNGESSSQIENLDLTLISWLLLFVSKSLDNVSSATYLEEGDKQPANNGKTKDVPSKWSSNTPYLNNRWNFLQAEDVLSHNDSSGNASISTKPLKGGGSLKCSNRRRIYARIVQQKLNYPLKLVHQKKHLWKNDLISGYHLGKASNGVAPEPLKKTKLSAFFKAMMSVKGAKVMPSKSSFSLVDSEDENQSALNNSLSGNPISDFSGPATSVKTNQKSGNIKKLIGNAGTSKREGGNQILMDGWDLQEWDPVSLVSRTTCLSLVRGLYNLILSLDINCHVDLFIVACKVLTRIMTSSKPTIQLSEVMTMQDVEKLLTLACGGEYNGGQKLWGGAWTSHIIICFLQDILEAERLGQHHQDANNSNDCQASSSSSSTNNASQMVFSSNVQSAMQCEDSDDEDDDDEIALANNSAVPDLMADCKFDEEMSMLVDALVHDEEMSNPLKAGISEALSEEQVDPSKSDWFDMKSLYAATETLDAYGFWNYMSDKEVKLSKNNWKDIDSFDSSENLNDSNSTWKFSNAQPPIIMPQELSHLHLQQQQKQQQTSINNNNKFSNNNNAAMSFNKATFQSKLPVPFFGVPLSVASKASPSAALFHQYQFHQQPFKNMPPLDYTISHAVSLAMDSRLEHGLELTAELKLKTMLALESNVIQSCLLQPLHLPDVKKQTPSATREAQVHNVTDSCQMCPSTDMLSISFSNMFKNLSSNRINLEDLLDLWLTLNDSLPTPVTSDQEPLVEGLGSNLVPIDDDAVSCLLQYVAQSASLNDRTWTLLFKCLMLVETYREYFSHGKNIDSDNEGSNLVQDPNFADIIQKFLSGSSRSRYPGSMDYKVGPLLVKTFHEFICSPSFNKSKQKGKLQDVLLYIVSDFSSPRGPFYSCNGPVDAQTLLVDDLTEMVDSIRAEPVRMSNSDMTRSDESSTGKEEGCLDLQVCLQVISNITSLVMLHISTVEPVLCQSSSEAFFINPRFCFTGLFQRTQKNGDPTASSFTSSCRDSLILSLLKLLDQLLRLPLPPAYLPPHKNVGGQENQSMNDPVVEFVGMDSFDPLNANIASTEQRVVLDVSPFAPEHGITDEQKASANQLSMSDGLSQSSRHPSTSGQQHCSHRNLFDMVGGSKGCEAKGMFGRSKMVADIVLGRLDIMFNLYSSLSMCSRDALASFKTDEPYNGENPFSVGDGVFKVLCTLNAKATSTELVVEPLYKFLAGMVGSPTHSSSSMTPYCRSLSEPLLLFAMKVVDCYPAMNVFAELGGIEMVCKNLVKSNEQAISTEPSLISTMMQYFGSSKVLNSGSLRMFGDRNSDGLQNFAPIGTISSSSQVASPSSVLIQNTPPPRRARSAAWSYHFYPEEKWVDLTITLPFAILLKEVIIVPHFSSLDTCPSAIIIESSRDGYSPSLPLCSPISTSGLTNIRVKLPSPKISTVVTIRFHKPQDSTILGLTQIMIMGTLALGPDVKVPPESLKSYASRNAEDNILKPNSEWLRFFHHCLVKGDCDTFHSRVILAASSVPNFLKVCVSLLLISPLPEAEKVLLLVGRHTIEASLQLIDIILGGCGIALEYLDENKDQSNSRTDGKISGNDHDSYTAILYNLCTFQDGFSLTRLSALLNWLSKCARCAIERRQNFSETMRESASPGVDAYLQSSVLNLNGPSVKSILCIAAIFWEMKKKCNLKEIIDKDFVGLMYNWSCLYSPNNSMKEAVDNVICSACYVRSDLFPNLVDCLDLFSRQTDDSKSDQDGGYDFFSNDAPVTDDIKADHRGAPDQSISSGRLRLTLWKLNTLATVSRAPKSLKYLEQIGFFGAICKLLYEFFSRKSPQTFSSRNGNPQRSYVDNNAELMPSLLDFLAEVSQENYVKDLLADPHNSSFWSPLLKNLCSRPTNMFPENVHLYKWNLPVLESCAIKFITNLISCHNNNQHVFSCTLLEVIRSTALPTSAFPSPLPGFLRRLLLQVILEDEKVVVYIRSKNLPMSKESHSQLIHPRFGAGHYHRTTVASIQSTLADVISSVSNYEAATLSQLLGVEPTKEQKNNNGKKQSTNQISVQQQSKAGGCVEKLAVIPTTSVATTVALYHPLMPDQPLPGELTLPQLQTILSNLGAPSSSSLIELDLRQWNAGQTIKECRSGQAQSILKTPQSSSLLQVFSGIGGLALLAERLPLLCPEFVRQTSSLMDGSAAAKAHQSPLKTYQSGFMPVDWTPMEVNEEIYEDPDETPISPPYSHSKPPTQSSTLQLQSTPSIPPHSLIAFGIFLRLPGYSEVLLKERKKAQYLLRLVLGVTDDGNGGLILNSSVASSLPSLPFQVLKRLLDSSPLTTDDGMLLRRMCVEIGVIHLILACLSILGHHAPRQHIPGLYQEILKVASQSQLYMSTTNSNLSASSNIQPKPTGEDKGQNYWAKGTGFGTGSTASSWDAEHALLRQKSEEEHVTCLLQVLASFINPRDSSANKSTASSNASFGSASSFAPSNHKSSANQPGTSPFGGSTSGSALPSCLPALLSQSCLLPALSSYLRNDSVLDMACHVPLYRALLELLQAIATCSPLITLLLPLPDDDGCVSSSSSSSSSAISTLLDKMKKCVDTYANRLKSNKVQPKEMTDDESEGLAPLIREIQDTSGIVNCAIVEYLSASGQSMHKDKKKDIPSSASPLSSSGAGVGDDWQTMEEKYLSIMKLLQYDTYKMVEEEKNTMKFMVPHHYEANVRAAGEVNNPLRARRLAQEAVTLSTSLPLSADSSVFVRCDEDRLDVMKVLMTGPSGTPYSQGCFEFDVFFPTDYPNSPPLINLQTTGNHSIRFNPNLYNDGKVCLSIINTWHGRPEEKWNSQTSSFLQVLVSVQSLILVNEPYFNEPGYERSRGTQFGMASSREYDSNIRQATVKWAMLEMIKNPPPAFKQIIQWHFWLKKDEILAQVEDWIADMESHTKDKRVGRNISQNLLSLKRHYAQLKEEFSKLPVPENVETWAEEVEDDDDDEGEEEIQNDEDDDVGISFSASSKADNEAAP